MAKGVITPQKKRDEIIAKIRDEGMTVADASRQYNIGPKAIYSWLEYRHWHYRGHRTCCRGRSAPHETAAQKSSNPLTRWSAYLRRVLRTTNDRCGVSIRRQMNR